MALVALLISIPAGQASAAPAPIPNVTTNPSVYPTFSTSIADYVTRCNPPTPVQVSVTVPPGMQAFVNGGVGHSSSFSTPVNLTPNHSFAVTFIRVATGETSTYFTRCLPSDFPNFNSSVPGSPKAAYYTAVPVNAAIVFGQTPVTQYIALFDNDGVPVWWTTTQQHAAYGTLPGGGTVGTVAWVSTSLQNSEEHKLSGPLARTISTTDGIDQHELQLLPNGNYLIASNVQKAGNDLSFIPGGPSSARILDQVVKEITPNGTVVWSWDALDHIPPNELQSEWYGSNGAQPPAGPTGVWDVYHFNSADQSADGTKVLVSFRHLDALYQVDKATGNIDWKLGGSSRAESLTFVGDPNGNFGGQHDARYYGPSSITVHDNGSQKSRPPRAVRFRINTLTHTATWLEQVTDPLVPASPATGSARKLPGGNWVAAWGFSPVATELDPAGNRQLLIQYTDNFFNYRAEPILNGVLSRTSLRSAMNAQYP